MNPTTSANRKALQQQIDTLTAANNLLHSEIKTKQQQQGVNSKRINELQAQLRKIPLATEPVVSDHALLRYLERIEQIDVDAARQQILCPSLKKALAVLAPGNGEFPLDGGGVAVMKNNVVVTVK